MGLLTNLDIRLDERSLLELAITVALTLTVVIVCKAVYNIYFHPLSKYPGPRLAAATRLWYCYHCCRGTLVYALHDLHQKYGDVVRSVPNELSFTYPSAWNDIYGHRVGKSELAKDPTFYSTLSSGKGSIIHADRSRHGHLRKQASHGFSERALRDQEHVIGKYADLLVQQLVESVEGGKPTVNIVDWYNFFTFDVMGEMVFGQSFNCLSSMGYHPWVRLIFDSVKVGAFIRCTKYFALLAPFSQWLVPKRIFARRVKHRQMVLEKAAHRKSIDDGRKDLISGFLAPGSGVTEQEFQNTAASLIIAGSETTATLMSGFTYYILRDVQRLAKLTAEIRNAFTSAEDITFVSANKLTYLLASLDEALRIYPPVPETLPRNTGPRTEVISGNLVPPNTVVGVHQWATYHSPKSFQDADDFVPERWLEGNKGYESDRRDAVQPFHLGPRNCLGRNLAFFEMRLLLARLFWQFDFELDARSAQWNQQKAFLFWEKPEMLVKLTPRSMWG